MATNTTRTCYEYCTLLLNSVPSVTDLNTYGKEGWELVQVVQVPPYNHNGRNINRHAYMKRVKL